MMVRQRFSRHLFQKYLLVLFMAVAIPLAINGVIEAWLGLWATWAVLGRRPIGLGLKIRRLLRCPASTYSQVFRRFLAAICDDVEANLGALCEGGETCPLDRRYMDEDILAAGIRLNETIPLRRIEPLHYPHRHVDFSMFKNQRWCQKFDKTKACPR